MNQKTKNSFERFFEWFKEFRSSDRGQLTICFILAFLVWFPVKLEKDYNAQGKLDIHFVAPKDYILSEKDLTDVSVNYFGSGFDIVKFKLFHNGKIDIYLPDRQGDFIFRNDQLNALIREQSNTEVDIVANTLEEIRLFSDLQIQKRVPIVSAIVFQAESGYIVQGDVELLPDSVEVKGPKKIIDTLPYISTEKKKINQLSQSLEDKISLIKPPGIQLNPEEVDFRLYVEQLTEKEVEVDLRNHLNLENGDSILIVPPKASIIVSLPISQYESFSEDMLSFSWTVDSLGQDNLQGLRALKISSALPSVEVLDFHPDSVRVLRVVSEE